MKTVLIGYGYWGKIVYKYLMENELFELIDIYDPAMQLSISLDDIFSGSQIECAFVCTPIETHFEIVKKLLKANLHVFCEKPLCKLFQEVQQLHYLANFTHCILYTDYIYAVSSSIQEMKKHIDRLGKIIYIDMSIKQFGNFYKNDDVIEVLAVHMISSLAYLFPDLEIIINGIETIKYNENNKIEDCIIQLKIGEITGKIRSSIIACEKERKITVICESGIICFDMFGEYTVQVIEHIKHDHIKREKYLIQKKYDEHNNLKYAINQFHNSIVKNNNDDNMKLTLKVSKYIDQIYKLLQIN